MQGDGSTSPSWMPEDPLSLKGGKEHGSSLHLLKEFDQSMTERDVGGTGEVPVST